MIQRAFVHVGGPPGGGKTMFIERLLESTRSKLLMVARGVRDETLERVDETSKRSDPEIGRYREAGASNTARYRFPGAARDSDAFFTSEFMSDYSQGVLIEGDSPLSFRPDLSVYVTPPVPASRTLLRRVTEDRSASHARELGHLERLLDTPGSVEEFLGNMLAAEFGGRLPVSDAGFADARRSMADLVARAKSQGAPPPIERWALADGFAGIELAQVVVINARSAGERERGEAMLPELVRLRKDRAVFDDVIGLRGNRLAVTVGVADVGDPGDKGLKRLLTRVKRAFAERK